MKIAHLDPRTDQVEPLAMPLPEQLYHACYCFLHQNITSWLVVCFSFFWLAF